MVSEDDAALHLLLATAGVETDWPESPAWACLEGHPDLKKTAADVSSLARRHSEASVLEKKTRQKTTKNRYEKLSQDYAKELAPLGENLLNLLCALDRFTEGAEQSAKQWRSSDAKLPQKVTKLRTELLLSLCSAARVLGPYLEALNSRADLQERVRNSSVGGTRRRSRAGSQTRAVAIADRPVQTLPGARHSISGPCAKREAAPAARSGWDKEDCMRFLQFLDVMEAVGPPLMQVSPNAARAAALPEASASSEAGDRESRKLTKEEKKTRRRNRSRGSIVGGADPCAKSDTLLPGTAADMAKLVGTDRREDTKKEKKKKRDSAQAEATGDASGCSREASKVVTEEVDNTDAKRRSKESAWDEVVEAIAGGDEERTSQALEAAVTAIAVASVQDAGAAASTSTSPQKLEAELVCDAGEEEVVVISPSSDSPSMSEALVSEKCAEAVVQLCADDVSTSAGRSAASTEGTVVAQSDAPEEAERSASQAEAAEDMDGRVDAPSIDVAAADGVDVDATPETNSPCQSEEPSGSAATTPNAPMPKLAKGKWSQVATPYTQLVQHRTPAARTFQVDSVNSDKGYRNARESTAEYDDPEQTKHAYEQLRRDNGNTGWKPPRGVDPRIREQYLEDAEFLRIFKMSRQDFGIQPKWRQQARKKDVGLF
eukprot:TRINITY_DN31495_c0_g2_i1.p1 TRINITY_DN31495_c0_g2~~TRINITY_DN31495_c0_g2_i1.p1  ORF type:complete len:659 (-),score=175.72 TRINITY_DN31495_c0_g2_i1:202-2178(-)